MLEVIYKIYQYASNGFYLGLFLYMMSRLFERRKFANWFTYYACPIMLFWVIYYYPQYALGQKTIPYYYYFATILVVALIWILFFLKGSIFSKMIYYVYNYTVYKCIVFILGGFLYDFEFKINHTIYEIVDMFSCSIVIAILLAFSKFCIKHPLTVTRYMNRFQLSLILFCPITFFIMLQLADPSINFPHTIFVSITAFFLLINLPIIYYLYITIGEDYESRKELANALMETSSQLTRYRYTILIEEQARKERHELKNQYFYIQTLLKEQKYEQLENFLTEHIGELSEATGGVHTNNILIDHIINTKLETARKNNIKTYTEILIPEELNINENYFCSVLLNLLDNAMEASMKESNPDIQILMNVRNNYLVCIVKNKVSKNILSTNPEFETTKRDKKNHGLGMKIIKDRVKKMDALFDTYMEGNYFTASIMIPINK